MDKAKLTNIKREAKLVQHFSEREVGEDTHIIREKLIHPDGKVTRDIRIVKDFQRPFWITKEMFRNHKEKKEVELKDRTYEFKSTQSRLAENIARRLGDQYVYTGKPNLRLLKESPYLYGIDVDARTIIKHKYLSKYDTVTFNEVAAFDIEKNILTDEIIVASLASKKGIFVGILSKLIWKEKEPITKLKQMYDKYIPDVDIKNTPLEFKIFSNELELLKWIFKQANNLDIDLLAIWNINYDIPEILDTLRKYEVDPADIFHYDKIPSKYKYFNFKEGTKTKVTASGRVVPKNPEEIWSTVKSSSNFYIIDAMAAHRYVRAGGATVPGGYSLDNILKEEGVAQKLKFDTGSVNQGAEWHIYMVKNKPLEYIIYNIWDTMSMLVLDDKTEDLKYVIDLLLGVSHYDIFNSGPKRIIDAYYFFVLSKGYVLGVKPSNVDTEDKLLGLDEWIVTLPGYRIIDNGAYALEEGNFIRTNIRTHICDIDAVSSYPSNIRAANVSKDTTHRELLAIEGKNKSEFKIENINLMFGPINSVQYCRNMFNFPSLKELAEAY